MRRPLLPVLIVVFALLAAGAAEARTPLTYARGKRAVVDYVQTRHPAGYRRNSLLIACGRHNAFLIGCDVRWRDRSGRCWAGNIQALKNLANHVVLRFPHGRPSTPCRGDF